MSLIFSVDPRLIIGPASILGGLYFLYICVADAKTLLNHWRQRPPAAPMRKSSFVNLVYAIWRGIYKKNHKSIAFLKERRSLARCMAPPPTPRG